MTRLSPLTVLTLKNEIVREKCCSTWLLFNQGNKTAKVLQVGFETLAASVAVARPRAVITRRRFIITRPRVAVARPQAVITRRRFIVTRRRFVFARHP